MHKMQNANNAAAAKCVHCRGCKMSTMQRPGFGQGSDRFGSVRPSLSMGHSHGRPADRCQAMRHGFEPADHAAPCANLLSVPISGTVPTGALHMVYD
jgi:hypothetical protein